MGEGLGSGAILLRAMQTWKMSPARRPMTRLRFILGDQLTRSLSALQDIDPGTDVVLMAEVGEETTYVRHHKQKIALVLSAMRHFADELRQDGLCVDYVTLDDPDNTHSFTGELERAIARHAPDDIIMTEPGEWRVAEMMQTWREIFGVRLIIRDDHRFLCPVMEFATWARGRKDLRMEFFYRDMRRKTGYLMDGDQPAGGQWNFDRENRSKLPDHLAGPAPLRFTPDPVTRQVLDLVQTRFPDHFGDLDRFGWAVTRSDALLALRHFLDHGLALFGDYQDAMKAGQDVLFHSALSPYLNCGLLTAREVCDAAQAAYHKGAAPLNSVEGFIRQIIGWREYVRGIYWTRMPDYARTNHLGAKRDLPWFYWSGETDLACLHDCLRSTQQNAYAHHIQRLMVTGNFALLAGIVPAQVEEWYLAVYADAFDWVELPNVHGMVLHADGGVLGSKPYAASGAYINRMSDYCRRCRYDPKQRTGADACPFNFLYWNFLIETRRQLAGNHRLAMAYKNLDRMGAGEQAEIVRQAGAFLGAL